MTQLATRDKGNGTSLTTAPTQSARRHENYTLKEVKEMAVDLAKSGMFFGVTSPEQAFVLLLLCQADGLHPIEAIRRYHVIKNRPAMRADAIQADFQADGGRIRWITSNAEVCEAQFTHPKYQTEPFTIRMEMRTFVENKVAMSYDRERKQWSLKDNWGNWPDAMLRARVASAGVRAIHPGVVVGVSSVDELEDIEAIERPRPAQIINAEFHAEAARAIAEVDTVVPGWGASIPDTRPYHLVATEGVASVNQSVAEAWGDFPSKPADLDAREVHKLIASKAVNLGHAVGPLPTKMSAGIAFVSKVYQSHRQWVRSELAELCREYADETRVALEGEAVKPEDVSQEPSDDGQGASDGDDDDLTGGVPI